MSTVGNAGRIGPSGEIVSNLPRPVLAPVPLAAVALPAFTAGTAVLDAGLAAVAAVLFAVALTVLVAFAAFVGCAGLVAGLVRLAANSLRVSSHTRPYQHDSSRATDCAWSDAHSLCCLRRAP